MRGAIDKANAGGIVTERLTTVRICVHFGPRPALEDVSVEFAAGKRVAIVGPNGAGKSTLLRVLGGMLAPTHGAVEIDGRPLVKPRPDIVYVPQRSGVDWTFPISVLDVTLMGRNQRRSRLRPFAGTDRERALAALADVGMERFAGIQIGQLSGGQQQRVFLARALVQGGSIYLLDEPFAGVDVPTQTLLIDLFARLSQAGKTIIYATHDLPQAAQSSDRVMLLNRHLIAAGPPGAVMTEANLRATFGSQVIIVGPETVAQPELHV